MHQVEKMPVQMPKTSGVPLSTALRTMLAQVKGRAASGTFVVRGDRVEVTTTEHANPRRWVGKDRDLAPSVDALIERQPLDEALTELASHSGISIVVAGETGGRHRKLVTAHLQGVPLDTGVRLLADMADLKVAVLDNVLYVATAEACRAMQLAPHGAE